MFEFILLVICSIFLARYLEKRSKIISAAHAILFIVLMVFYFFNTEFPLVVKAATNMFGVDNYKVIHEAFVESSMYSRIGFSSLFAIEIVINSTIAIVSIIATIKAFKLIVKEYKFYNDFKLNQNIQKSEYYPRAKDVKCSFRTYLLNCSLLN